MWTQNFDLDLILYLYLDLDLDLDLGFFVFQTLRNGYYFVEINFMGVEPWKSEEIYISKKNNRINIGKIELQNKLIEAQRIE